MTSRRLAASAGIGLTAALLLAACGGSSSHSAAASGGGSTKSEVVVGAIDDLTGPAAAIGTLDKQSSQLAINAINSQGGANGHQIKLVFYDNKSDPAQTAQLVTRLVTQDHAVVISCCATSDATAAAAAVAGADKVPLITSAVQQDLTATSKSWYGDLFRVIPSNNALAQANVDFVKSKGWTKVGLDVTSLSYGTSAIPFFKTSLASAGATIVATTTQSATTTDASVVAAQLVRAKPDVIMTWDYPAPTAQLVKALRASGSQIPVVSNWSAINQTMTSIAGTTVSNLFAHDDAVAEKPAVQSFAQEWKAQYNQDAPVNNFGIFGYNIIQVATHAIATAKTTDPAGVLAALQALNCYKTIVGAVNSCITFGPNNYEGAQGGNFVVFKSLQNGTWSVVGA